MPSLGVGVAGFDPDGGVVDAGVEGDAVELADVVSSGGVPVGRVETELVDGGDPRVGAACSVAPYDDAGVVAVVGGRPRRSARGGWWRVPNTGCPAGAADVVPG